MLSISGLGACTTAQQSWHQPFIQLGNPQSLKIFTFTRDEMSEDLHIPQTEDQHYSHTINPFSTSLKQYACTLFLSSNKFIFYFLTGLIFLSN